MAAKQKTDWDAVEPVYRAGVKTLRQIAIEFGCTGGRVAQVAKERGWERDLGAKIRAKVQAKLNKSALNAELKAQKIVSEREVIAANAEMHANIVLAHRGDIRRNRELAARLLAEIEAVTDSGDLCKQLARAVASGDDAALNMAYRRVVSLPGRIDSTKKLAETLKILIGLEREAFGIEQRTVGQTLDDFLDGLAATTN